MTRALGLARLGYMLATSVVAVVVLFPWLQGPANVAVASWIGWCASGVLAERRADRPSAFGSCCAQGLVCAITIYLTLGWLSS